MSESNNPNYLIQLFIRTLQVKHKLTFQKEKEEYFRVLFDTYLNGQGNVDELREYIAAGVDNEKVIDTIYQEVVEWQGKAAEMRAAEEAKKTQQKAQAEKLNEYVDKKTKKAKEDAQNVKTQDHGRKKQKTDRTEGKAERAQKGQKGQKPEKGQKGEGKEGQAKGLKQELSAQGKEKCKFYPFCKNPQSCEYFHPSEKCTYFPNCRYGQECLYEHEPCKYKEKCLKPNCVFAHPFKKSNPYEAMMKSFMSSHNPLNRKKKPFHKAKEQAGGEQHQEEPKKE